MNKEDFRKQLLEAKSPREIFEIFQKEEETLTEG
jgi:mannitol/fructose-specific phosphotransferase system IIA component (Ntr-type)